LPELDALDRTHRQTMEALVQLDQLIQHLEREGLDATSRRLAAETCEFFDVTGRAHHADEERLVFPALLSSGNAELVAHVRRLQQDHGWLEEDWIELEPVLRTVAEGIGGYDLGMLKAAVPVFAQLYHEHIALEESLIYPEARRRMSQVDAARAQRVADAGSGSA
jgi:hemerythrin-like domain-containing protein